MFLWQVKQFIHSVLQAVHFLSSESYRLLSLPGRLGDARLLCFSNSHCTPYSHLARSSHVNTGNWLPHVHGFKASVPGFLKCYVYFSFLHCCMYFLRHSRSAAFVELRAVCYSDQHKTMKNSFRGLSDISHRTQHMRSFHCLQEAKRKWCREGGRSLLFSCD